MELSVLVIKFFLLGELEFNSVRLQLIHQRS